MIELYTCTYSFGYQFLISYVEEISSSPTKPYPINMGSTRIGQMIVVLSVSILYRLCIVMCFVILFRSYRAQFAKLLHNGRFKLFIGWAPSFIIPGSKARSSIRLVGHVGNNLWVHLNFGPAPLQVGVHLLHALDVW